MSENLSVQNNEISNDTMRKYYGKRWKQLTNNSSNLSSKPLYRKVARGRVTFSFKYLSLTIFPNHFGVGNVNNSWWQSLVERLSTIEKMNISLGELRRKHTIIRDCDFTP